jgi:AcrR family transcriptional regulator
MLFKSLNIENEKEDRIVNAASKVFAKNGYQNASTNEIVKEAGISKGLLFHYFTSKKDLYLTLYHHLTDLFLDKIYEQIDWEQKDIFLTLRQVALVKFELFKKYPEMINFLTRAYNEDSKDVVEEIKQKKEELIANSFNRLFTNIDVTKFKEGIEVPKAIEVIYWTFEGFSNRKQAQLGLSSIEHLNVEAVLAEIDSYIELLKMAFYK